MLKAHSHIISNKNLVCEDNTIRNLVDQGVRSNVNIVDQYQPILDDIGII